MYEGDFCPICGAKLNDQSAYSESDIHYTCSKCGIELIRGCPRDCWNVVEEIHCPKCDTYTLQEWAMHQDDVTVFTCSCGAHLHRDSWADEWKVLDEE